VKFEGSNTTPSVKGRNALPGKSNYFIGNDPANWRTDVPHFERVEYEDVYPNIDVAFYGNQKELEYDFVIRPAGDPTRIKLRFSGARDVRVTGEGDLLVRYSGGELRQRRPLIYQEVEGLRRIVSGRYLLDHQNRVSFKLGDNDRTRELTIDPVLVFSTFLGGSSGGDFGEDIEVDESGNAYMLAKLRPLISPPRRALLKRREVPDSTRL
jgi:hypothetical protein